MHVTCRAYRFLCLQLVCYISILKNSLSIVVVSYEKLSQFVKYFSFTSSFDGKILDKSYNLKNFYNSVFIAFENKSSCTNLENYTNQKSYI